MKTISYNPTVAMSILLGAVASSLNPQAVVLVSSKDGSNFKKILEDAGINPESRYAVVLIDEYNDKGQLLELGIEALYHDWPTNYEKKSKLINIFGNSKTDIDEVVSQGRTISEYTKSPSFTGEIVDNSEDEDAPEFKSTEDLLHPSHLKPEDTNEVPIDFDDFVDVEKLINIEDDHDKKADIAAALNQGTNIDGIDEATQTAENADVVIVSKNDADIDDVSIPDEFTTEEEQNTSSVETPEVEPKKEKKSKK